MINTLLCFTGWIVRSSYFRVVRVGCGKCWDEHAEAQKSLEERAVTLGTRWSTLFRAFRHLRGLYFNYETGNWVNHSRFTASGEWNFSCRRFQACVHIRPTAARLKFNEISAENTSPLVSNNSSMFPGEQWNRKHFIIPATTALLPQPSKRNS